MKRIATWAFATIGGAVLLFSYKTSTEAVSPSAAAPGPASAQAGSAPATTSPSAQASPSPTQAAAPSATPAQQKPASAPQKAQPSPPPPASGLKDGTYSGARQDTPYGPVQVKVTISGGKVSGATATSYPTGSRRDAVINGYAVPRLQSEAVGTTDGHIDMVSGATYTSGGFIGSLQDAINQAR